MEKIELSDDEMDDNITEVKEQFLQNQINCDVEKPLDPRAGRIDVDLPQIPFNSEKIVILLNKYKFHPSSTTKSRRQLRRLIKEYTNILLFIKKCIKNINKFKFIKMFLQIYRIIRR